MGGDINRHGRHRCCHWLNADAELAAGGERYQHKKDEEFADFHTVSVADLVSLLLYRKHVTRMFQEGHEFVTIGEFAKKLSYLSL